jgi:hypothetical protein
MNETFLLQSNLVFDNHTIKLTIQKGVATYQTAFFTVTVYKNVENCDQQTKNAKPFCVIYI